MKREGTLENKSVRWNDRKRGLGRLALEDRMRPSSYPPCHGRLGLILGCIVWIKHQSSGVCSAAGSK